MKTYKIPCEWKMYGYYEIRANNLKKAIEIAEEAKLPEGEYLSDSFEIDFLAFKEFTPLEPEELATVNKLIDDSIFYQQERDGEIIKRKLKGKHNE